MIKGTITSINISKEKGVVKTPVDTAICKCDHGIVGDAHAGNWHRQVSLISKERIDAFKERGAQVEDGAFGENLIVEGYDFKTLPAGTVFRCNDVILEMTQIGKECHAHCAIYKQVGDCIMPREGVFAVVKHGGVISEGDELVIVEED